MRLMDDVSGEPLGGQGLNWFASFDYELADRSQRLHSNIEVHEARELALPVPQPLPGT